MKDGMNESSIIRDQICLNLAQWLIGQSDREDNTINA